MKTILAIFLAATLTTAIGRADDTPTNRQDFVFNANLENDLFILPETDRHYTQGLHFSLLWPDDEVPVPIHPLSWTPPIALKNPVHKFGFEIGQNMYTPDHIINPALQRNDRPYAGWLFIGFLREDRSSPEHGIPTLDRYELQLGIIGPWALGENGQNWWHGVIDAETAEGWGNQIKNEPGILLRLDRKWRIMDLSDGDLHLQMLPRAGIALGNVETSARLGTTMRLGIHIPDEFAVVPPTFGWYVFTDLGVRGVLYNAFLDGNLYQKSQSVTKEPFVIELRGGLVLEIGPNEISYTYVYLTREFQLQEGHDSYASLNYTYRF